MATTKKPANHIAMRPHQSHNLGEHQREWTVLRDDLFTTVQGSVRHVAQWHLI